MTLRNELGDIFGDSISADEMHAPARDELWKKQCAASQRLEDVVNDARTNVAELAAKMVD